LYEILAPKITKPNITREKLLNLLLYKKHARKMLMKLTTGQELIDKPSDQIVKNFTQLHEAKNLSY